MHRQPSRPLLLLLCIALLLLQTSSAALTPQGTGAFDQVLINSKDWQDIYQGFLYARLTGVPVDYIIDPMITDDVIASLPREDRIVLLIQPTRRQQQASVEGLLKRAGFDVNVLEEDRLGIALAETLPLKNVFITDERYPYNAVSLAPYALQQEGFVLFSGAGEDQELIDYLEQAGAPITTYGIIDQTTKEALTASNPRIIDEGGKFDNNLYVVKAFLAQEPKEQVFLTNGEFLEEGLLTANYPTLFIGKNRVPDQVEDYLATADIEAGVLVGNYLTDIATSLKRRLQSNYDKEMIFVVKFARTPRVIESQFSSPVSLEYFALPINEPNLTITNIAYNRRTSQLEVTYENPSLIPVFFQASFTITAGDDILTIGNDETNMIASGQQKTLLYDTDLSMATSLSADARVYFGDYENSLEYLLEQSFHTLPIIDIADPSALEIIDLVYDKIDKAFYITIKNPGTVDVYANIELQDVIIDGLATTIGTQKIAHLEPGEQTQVYIRARLSSLDLLENEDILSRGYYGSRETVLAKTTEKTFPLKVRTFKGTYLVGAAAIIILLLLLYLFFRKKDYACDRCGHTVRSRKKPYRHTCGGKFKRHHS